MESSTFCPCLEVTKSMKFTQLYQQNARISQIPYDLRTKLCFFYSTGFCPCDQLLINPASGTLVLDKQMHTGWQNHGAEIFFSFIFICRPRERRHDQGSLATQSATPGRVGRKKGRRSGSQRDQEKDYETPLWVPTSQSGRSQDSSSHHILPVTHFLPISTPAKSYVSWISYFNHLVLFSSTFIISLTVNAFIKLNMKSSTKLFKWVFRGTDRFPSSLLRTCSIHIKIILVYIHAIGCSQSLINCVCMESHFSYEEVIFNRAQCSPAFSWRQTNQSLINFIP